MTLEQHRMHLAYAVTRQQTGTDEAKRKWKTMIEPFGIHVQRSGLLQGMAFAQRSGGPHEAFLGSIDEHLHERAFLPRRQANAATFLDEIAAADLPSRTYMLVTREVLALSLWFKRAAQAICGDE
jgi:CRISPR/Cas system CMR-associated protein Cmr5 small subunit